jgi:hypothetical protein
MVRLRSLVPPRHVRWRRTGSASRLVCISGQSYDRSLPYSHRPVAVEARGQPDQPRIEGVTETPHLTIDKQQADTFLGLLIKQGQAIRLRMKTELWLFAEAKAKGEKLSEDYYHSVLESVTGGATPPPITEFRNAYELSRKIVEHRALVKDTHDSYERWRIDVVAFVELAFGGSGNSTLARFRAATDSLIAADGPEGYAKDVEEGARRGLDCLNAAKDILGLYPRIKPNARPGGGRLRGTAEHPLFLVLVGLATIAGAVVAIIVALHPW